MSLVEIRKRMGTEPPKEEKGESLDCAAHGCPLRWSVDAGNGRLCSYHAWTDAKQWHGITEALRRDGPWSLQKTKEIVRDKYVGDMKGWAKRLRDRHESGEDLPLIHIQLYRAALRMGAIDA